MVSLLVLKGIYHYWKYLYFPLLVLKGIDFTTGNISFFFQEVKQMEGFQLEPVRSQVGFCEIRLVSGPLWFGFCAIRLVSGVLWFLLVSANSGRVLVKGVCAKLEVTKAPGTAPKEGLTAQGQYPKKVGFLWFKEHLRRCLSLSVPFE